MQSITEPFSFIASLFETYPIISQLLGLFISLIVLAKLFDLLKQSLLFYRQSIYKKAIEWTLLEIKIPREVMKTPQAMEQFFANIHDLRNSPGNLVEKYIDGEVTLWWSMEIVSFGGEIHFYIKTPKKHKKAVESGLYAQYPFIEIEEMANDYVKMMPKTTEKIYQKGYDIYGNEFFLKNPNAYPITTYEKFELDKEKMAIDPISALLEVLANMHQDEMVFIQILIRPTGPEWQKEGQKVIDKLIGRETKTAKGKSLSSALFEIIRNLSVASVKYPDWSTEKPKEEKLDLRMMKLTPGERDFVQEVENKISKPGFETTIRLIYYAPISIFNANFIKKGVIGALNQYASQSSNSFKKNTAIETGGNRIDFPYLFLKKRIEAKKQRILYNFHNRKMTEELKFGMTYTSHPLNFNTQSKVSILSTAELATIYHIPAEGVLTAPHTKIVDSKKIGPPAGLPIFEE